MPDSSADRDPLDVLAEEFVVRFRAGERPAIEEYAARLPGREGEVRDLFPALVEMERLKPVTADRTGPYTPAVGPADPERVGEYRILRRVGVGGMGVVYEAVQESLGRHVALKLLPLDALADPKRLERFRREARAAARLHHTNIVPVFGTGEADGRHFYAMQFIAGHPLDAVIDEVRRLKDRSAAAPGVRAVSEVAAAVVTGTFRPADPASDHDPSATVAASPPPAAAPAPPPTPAASTSLSGGRHYHATVARLAAQAADALAYAHAHGVLHRDVKPANLLLDLHGTVWVTDFGLAKTTEADDLTHAGDVIGTLRYMAPERFDGRGDERADVYALGLTLYELLTLKPAFAADTRARLVEQVLAASPPRPRAVDPTVPRDLETIVLKATARDPAMRYAGAAALADDLRRYAEDRPILARRASTVEQTWRWCRRNPAVASLLAMVLVCLTAITALAVGIAVDQARLTGEANRARKEANARPAVSNYDRGQEECERGRTGEGMLRLAASWRAATAAEDAELARVARLSLSAWQSRLPRFRAVISHPQPIISAAYVDNGRLVATLHGNDSVRIWDAGDGRPAGEPLRHPHEVRSLGASADGTTLATGAADGSARVWNLATRTEIGRPIVTGTHGQYVWLSLDGKLVYAGDTSGVKCWEVGTEQPKFVIRTERIGTGAGSPDGKWLILCDQVENKARVWNARTGEPLGAPLVHEDFLTAAHVSPDSSRVVTAARDKAYVWELATGRLLAKLDHGVSNRHVQFGPRGDRVLTAGVNTARLWAISNNGETNLLATLPHAGVIEQAVFNPDGSAFVTACADGTAHVWDARDGSPVGRPFDHMGPVGQAAFSPNGRSVLTRQSDGVVKLWDATTSTPDHIQLDHATVVACVRFSPDGRTVVTGCNDGTAQLWNVADGMRIGEPLKHQSRVWAAEFSPDGSRLFTGCHLGACHLWDVESRQPLGPHVQHSGNVYYAWFSPDGTRLLVQDDKCGAVVLDGRTGAKLESVLPGRGTDHTQTFSPDTLLGQFADERRSLQSCRLSTSVEQSTTSRRTGEITYFNYSSAWDRVVTTSLSKAYLWDTRTGQPIGFPLVHPGKLDFVGFTPDGRGILTGCTDTKGRLWDIGTGKQIGPSFEHTDRVWFVAMSPDGRTVATASEDRTVRLWRWDELVDDPDRVTNWVEAATGLTIDDSGAVVSLDRDEWHKRQDRVARDGGPPFNP